MILHIEFIDGSNPYVFYPRAGIEAWDYSPEARGRAIVKEFTRWKRSGFFPENYFSVYVDGLKIEHDFAGVWFIRYDNKAKTYKHLGTAIRGAISLKKRGF